MSSYWVFYMKGSYDSRELKVQAIPTAEALSRWLAVQFPDGLEKEEVHIVYGTSVTPRVKLKEIVKEYEI